MPGSQNKKLRLIYQKLYDHFGPQHWWPGDSAFEVAVGAILTQNTNWQNVEKAINNLKKSKVLNFPGLYRMPAGKLALLIRPAGYYNIKSKRLKSFLRFLFNNYRGSLKKMSSQDMQKLRTELLGVHGVGPETADSILLYALKKPVFVVDAYTRRILSRHGFIGKEAGYEETQNLFMKNLGSALSKRKKGCKIGKGGVELFNEYHALLVKLGKECCLKRRPKCKICPLK